MDGVGIQRQLVVNVELDAIEVSVTYGDILHRKQVWCEFVFSYHVDLDGQRM